MVEFFSGLIAVLMWLPFGFIGLTQEIYLDLSNLRYAGSSSEASQSSVGVIEPGVIFSFKQAESLGLDSRQTFIQTLDDLRPKYLRVIAYWDRIEKKDNEFDFSELDFQMNEAEKREIETTLIIGEKVPRWPECHYPEWFGKIDDKAKAEEQVIEYLTAVIGRYKDYPRLEFWQLENEPSLAFGDCPAFSPEFFSQKLQLFRKASSKPVVVTTSGELDTWLRAFLYGDEIGFSVYRRFFVSLPFKKIGLNYPLPPRFYKAKAGFFQLFFKKGVMITEFQLEPWLDKSLKDAGLEEQFKELGFEAFEKQIRYAQKTGIQRIYFWGTEWWYWLKQNGHPEFLDYVRQNVFNLPLSSEKK